jgi:hypothetical protein
VKVETMADSASSVVNANIFLFIVGQVFAGQLIKKIVPLFLTMQIIFYVVLELPFPLNTTTVLKALDDAIKLLALKELIFSKLEDNESLESIKELADESGMVVLIGVPLIVVLTIVSIIITCCCKKNVKC